MPESTTGVVEFDSPTTEPNYQEPTGLTLDQVDDDLNPIENVDTPTDQEAEPQPQAPWYEGRDNELVTVKVNGRDVQVPFKEALMGYQRQQDYTQKTTEVAQMRKAAEWGSAMQQALQTDPLRTLTELAQALGIGFNPNADTTLGEEVFDSEDARFAQFQAELDNRISPLAAEVEVAKMQREISSLERKYGEDFDSTEVISLVQEQLNYGRDISFEQAFHMLQGQKALEQRRAAAERKQRETAQRAGNAANVGRIVNTPNPASRGLHEAARAKEMSLREIFELVEAGNVT